MENNKPEFFPDKFSEDPQENLRIENEILQMTIKAELGGELMKNTELPPELENEFLKNIIAFEHAYADARQIKVYDLLGRPAFKKADELNDTEIFAALGTVTALLKDKEIEVDFMGDYDSRIKYAFITEELFEHETEDLQIPGMTTHFCYEEFHPNHRNDIEARAREFISAWFEHHINEDSWWLGDPFILADGTMLPRAEVIGRIRVVLDAYTSFTDDSYRIYDINFELHKEDETGLGHAEGMIKYKAILESGEAVHMEGPFKLYMSLEYSCWSIFYFVFPGFTWE